MRRYVPLPAPGSALRRRRPGPAYARLEEGENESIRITLSFDSPRSRTGSSLDGVPRLRPVGPAQLPAARRRRSTKPRAHSSWSRTAAVVRVMPTACATCSGRRRRLAPGSASRTSAAAPGSTSRGSGGPRRPRGQLAHAPDQFDHFGGISDHAALLAQQFVHPRREPEVTGPGTPMTSRPSRRRVPGGRPASRCAVQPRPRPCPGSERRSLGSAGRSGCASDGRRAATRPSSKPLFTDAPDQLGVARRVGDIHPARQHPDGGAPCGQCAPVRGAVDTVGGTGDHRPAPLGEPRAEHGRHVHAVLRAGPGPDDGDRTQRPEPQIRARRAPTARSAWSRPRRRAARATRESPGHTNRPPARLDGCQVRLGTCSLRAGAQPGPALLIDAWQRLPVVPRRHARLPAAPYVRSHLPAISSPGSTIRVNAARASCSSESTPPGSSSTCPRSPSLDQ